LRLDRILDFDISLSVIGPAGPMHKMSTLTPTHTEKELLVARLRSVVRSRQPMWVGFKVA
jgi:hypothetical protein